MRVIDLREEEVGRFSRATLNEHEVIALDSSGKFDVEPASLLNGNTYGLRSRGWVGQIPVGDDLLVRITPKVGVSSVFRMLEVAYHLRSFRLFDGEVQVESLDEIYERIVSILARRVLDRARKGLYRGYIERVEDVPYVRGRMNALGTALNRHRGVPRLPCDFEEQTADLDDNRILHWTLHRVPRQGLRNGEVKIELDRARRALTGAIALSEWSAADCVGRFYHRLNEDYAPMHGLCRFILENTGPGIRHGETTFIPFELNMPQLFEAFVAEWMRRNPPSGTGIRCQHNARIDANFEMKIHIDIVVYDERTQQPIAVLDTKYKANEQPSEADIYQIAFYARELSAKHAVLVYPSTTTKPVRMRHGSDILLDSVVFDINGPQDAADANFRDALSRCLGL